MKFLMFVCWDAKKMDAQTEPDPTATANPESFPWLDDLQARGSWTPATNLPHRAGPVPSASATGRPSSQMVLSSRAKRPSADSTSSNAAALRRPSRSQPGTLLRGRGRSRCGHSGGTEILARDELILALGDTDILRRTSQS